MIVPMFLLFVDLFVCVKVLNECVICFLQICWWEVQEDQHNRQQGFLLNNYNPTLHLSSAWSNRPINKREIWGWTSQWPLFSSLQSRPVTWVVTVWWPFPAVASHVSRGSQLGLAVVFSGSGGNSSRGELHLPHKWKSSRKDEVGFPQRGAEQDCVGGAREVTVITQIHSDFWQSSYHWETHLHIFN